MKFLVIGIILLLFTSLVVVDRIVERHHYAALQREGIRGDVQVRRAAIVETRGGPSYRLYLNHAVEPGKLHTEKNVPQRVYEDYAQDVHPTPPRTISIRYLPRNPEIFEIIDPRIPSDYYAPLSGDWMGVLFLGIPGIFLLRKGLHDRR